MTTTENRQRDELLDDILASALANLTDYTDAPREIADTILSEGYRKPRTVTTVEELDALPAGIVLRSSSGTIASRFNRGYGVLFGDDRPIEWARLSLPATVLYEPEAEAGA